METGRITVPEEILLEIIARLPLRSIARFKPVCKTWKSMIDTDYFHRLFLSLHKSLPSSWSLMFQAEFRRPITEAIVFHGCKIWGLQKSLGSYIFPKPYPRSLIKYRDSSSGLVYIEVYDSKAGHYTSLVCSPVLKQWVRIPEPPDKACHATGLVTRVENGFLSSFKVVRTCHSSIYDDMYEWRVYVYSSESGLWTFKRLLSSHRFHYNGNCGPSSMNLNGRLFLWERGLDPTKPGVLVVYGFYGSEDDDQCRVIPLPLPYNKCVRRCLTTSRGDAIYIEILDGTLKIWRLNNHNYEGSECWQLSREINMVPLGFDVNCYPMRANPFDADIVYLWSSQHRCLVYGNLQRKEFILHQESKNCGSSEGCYRLHTHDSKKYMEGMYGSSRVLILSQFVLPQWMDSGSKWKTSKGTS